MKTKFKLIISKSFVFMMSLAMPTCGRRCSRRRPVRFQLPTFIQTHCRRTLSTLPRRPSPLLSSTALVVTGHRSGDPSPDHMHPSPSPFMSTLSSSRTSTCVKHRTSNRTSSNFLPSAVSLALSQVFLSFFLPSSCSFATHAPTLQQQGGEQR